MKLKRAVDAKVLFENLTLADSAAAKRVGLLGKNSLPENEAMYFPNGMMIHTWFMKFSIDCVFVDKKGKIKKIYHDVKPWRFAGPVWGALDVIEMAAGLAKAKNLNVGDVVECGP
jgi:uncharacterized protein